VPQAWHSVLAINEQETYHLRNSILRYEIDLGLAWLAKSSAPIRSPANPLF